VLKKILKNEIFLFIAKFFILFGVLYAFNYFIIGLTIPGGYYNEWLAKHLDYVTVFRTLILKGASIFCSLFGFESYTNKYDLYLPGISRVRMVYSCIGFDVLCFWAAFTFAFPQNIKRKLLYFFTGLMAITLVNMIRVGGLAMIHSVQSLRRKHIDHHTIFNVIVYGLIFMMVIKMVNGVKRDSTKTVES